MSLREIILDAAASLGFLGSLGLAVWFFAVATPDDHASPNYNQEQRP